LTVFDAVQAVIVFGVIAIGTTMHAVAAARARARSRREIRCGTRTFDDARAFIETFARETGLPATGGLVVASLENARFEGKVAERDVQVSFSKQATRDAPPHHARLVVRAERAPRFRVGKDDASSLLARAFGIVPGVASGSAQFDGHYVVHAAPRERERAQRALHETTLRTAIDTLFAQFKVESLESDGESVTATGPLALADPERARTALTVLALLTRLLERVPITVKVLGGERHAFRSERGAARCAYCHADVTGDEPDLVACEGCATVLHAGCWEELGRCPVLGCASGKPERARTAERA